MVVTDLPSAATVRSVQLFIETPSTWTTQAPHCEVSQPKWVPVRSSVSRRKSDRSSDGATSALTFLPLTDISTFMCVLLLYLDQRPLFRGILQASIRALSLSQPASTTSPTEKG